MWPTPTTEITEGKICTSDLRALSILFLVPRMKIINNVQRHIELKYKKRCTDGPAIIEHVPNRPYVHHANLDAYHMFSAPLRRTRRNVFKPADPHDLRRHGDFEIGPKGRFVEIPCHTQRSRSFVPRRCDRIGSSRRLTARGARTLHWCNELATLLRGDSAAIAKPGATQLPRCGTFSTIVFPLSILCQPRREATFRGWKTEVLVFCMSERPVIFHTHTHIHIS